jgi:hypothetical protein
LSFDAFAGARFDPSGMPSSIALAIGAGVHNWRVDHAPPPAGVLWDNVGTSPLVSFFLIFLSAIRLTSCFVYSLDSRGYGR